MNYLKNIILILAFIYKGTFLFGQVADFQMDTTVGCDSIIVKFVNNSTLIPGVTTLTDYTFTWNFGRPLTTSTKDDVRIITDLTKTVSCKFNKTGKHKITFTLEHKNKGIKESKTDSVIVRPHPNAWFSVADTFNLGPLTYRFRSGKAPSDTIIYYYSWKSQRIDPEKKIVYPVNTIAFHNSANEPTINKIKRDTIIVPFNASEADPYRMYLIVKDGFGCIDMFDTIFTVSEKLVVPKFFSPNNDNINDYLFVETNGRDKYHFEVFTSRGQRIYSSESKSIIWDGIIEDSGQPAPAGTYYYYIEPVGIATKTKESGFFVLFREK